MPKIQKPPSTKPSAFTGFRFPPEIIMLAVRWYLKYGLSYRDFEELLAERGIEVDRRCCIQRKQGASRRDCCGVCVTSSEAG